MAKDPAFLFYPNDYLGGTMGMTFEEKGAYMELLMLQFNRGHMTKDMIGRTVGQLWVNIKDKFKEDADGCFYNERLELEQTKRKAFSESRRNNRKGVNQHTKEKQKDEGHMTSHMVNANEDVNKDLHKTEIDITTPDLFEMFWQLYQKGTNRLPAQKEWFNIDHAEYQKIIIHVPKYVQATKDVKFRKDAVNYLKDRVWQDAQLPNYATKQEQQDVPVYQRPYAERVKFAEENGIKVGTAQYNRLVNKTGI